MRVTRSIAVAVTAIVVVSSCGESPSDPASATDASAEGDAAAGDATTAPEGSSTTDGASPGADADASDASALAPALPTWSRTFGTHTSRDYLPSAILRVLQTDDRNFFAITSSGVAALKTDGSVLWRSTFAQHNAVDVVKAASGTVMLLNRLSATPDSKHRAQVVEIELATGVEQRGIMLGAPLPALDAGSDAAMDASADAAAVFDGDIEPKLLLRAADGGYLVIAELDHANIWLAKLDPNLSLLWQRAIDQSSIGFYGAVANPDGSFALAGYASDDAVVATVGPGGDILWSKRYGAGAGAGDYARGIVRKPDGAYVVVGDSTFPGDSGHGGANEIWAFEIDGAGAFRWQKTFESGGSDLAWNVTLRHDGNVTIAGILDGSPWLATLDGTGNVAWQKKYAPPSGDASAPVASSSLSQLVATDDGGYLLGGSMLWKKWSTFGEGSVGWLVRADGDGNVAACAAFSDVTSTTTTTAAAPLDVTLSTTTTSVPLVQTALIERSNPQPGEISRDECTGTSTTWGSGEIGASCTCSPGVRCVGPSSGCAFGLSCVGHYSNGGNAIGDCAARCATTPNCTAGGTCRYLTVGNTNMGAWCY
jgi:hypothetical protein